jgi:hypothetical protein
MATMVVQKGCRIGNFGRDLFGNLRCCASPVSLLRESVTSWIHSALKNENLQPLLKAGGKKLKADFSTSLSR